ncbi:hypothetical protein KKD72_02885 [Patescibacteria group bacterium]|nr:hypothetical protein [Patescibacteria group bacterium]
MDNQDLPTTNGDQEKIVLSSKKKWFWLGIAVALLSPISGVILAVALLSESKMKKAGLIILVLSFIWGIISFYLNNWLVSSGYLPAF